VCHVDWPPAEQLHVYCSSSHVVTHCSVSGLLRPRLLVPGRGHRGHHGHSGCRGRGHCGGGWARQLRPLSVNFRHFEDQVTRATWRDVLLTRQRWPSTEERTDGSYYCMHQRTDTRTQGNVNDTNQTKGTFTL